MENTLKTYSTLLPANMTGQKLRSHLAATNAWKDLVESMYKQYDANLGKGDVNYLMNKIKEMQGRMPPVQMNMRIPVLRYFVRAQDAKQQDLDVRKQILGYNTANPDPLEQVMKNIEQQKAKKAEAKKKKKDEQEADRQDDGEVVSASSSSESSSSDSESESSSSSSGEGSDDGSECHKLLKKYGANIKVWGVPTESISSAKIINTDIFDQTTFEAHVCIADIPWGGPHPRFKGDQALGWTDTNVSSYFPCNHIQLSLHCVLPC